MIRPSLIPRLVSHRKHSSETNNVDQEKKKISAGKITKIHQESSINEGKLEVLKEEMKLLREINIKQVKFENKLRIISAT